MPDWGTILTAILTQSPIWGPFLIALFGILYFVVKPLLNGVRDTAIKQSESIGANTAALLQLTQTVQKVADSQNAILMSVFPHTALIGQQALVGTVPPVPPAEPPKA